MLAPGRKLAGQIVAELNVRRSLVELSDRTVVTYDPRGSERSVKDDPASPTTPDDHAEDLHRIVDRDDAGQPPLGVDHGHREQVVARHDLRHFLLVGEDAHGHRLADHHGLDARRRRPRRRATRRLPPGPAARAGR